MKETADPYTSLCDFDGKLPAHWFDRLCQISRFLGNRLQWARLDKTKHGHHLIVRWKDPFTPAEMVAVQAMLGSDYKREALNLSRVRAVKGGTEEEAFGNILYAQKFFS